MRYTPAQLKEALDISEDSLRYWRANFPQLKGKRGYAPCFTPGDLLALKVVAELRDLGMNIGVLKAHADEFFEKCSARPWFDLEKNVLEFDGRSMKLAPKRSEPSPYGMRVIIPLGPLVRQLRQRLSEEERLVIQPEIVFPPVAVAKRGAR